MSILFVLLKYLFIAGLAAAALSVFAASVRSISKNIQSGFVFFSTTVIFFFLLLSVLIYQSKWQLFCKDRNIIKSIQLYDKRGWLDDQKKKKGDIFDRTGKDANCLAFSIITPDMNKRVYPFNEAASHLTGYSDIEKGRTGIEDCFYDYLLGERVSFFRLTGEGDKKKHNLYLTIDSEIQLTAYKAFHGRCGAAVVIVPGTGEVLALVSSPGIPVNDIGNDVVWSSIVSDSEKAPLFNRAVRGLYPPGSVFKIITAAAAIEKKREQKLYCSPDGYVPPKTRRPVYDIERKIYKSQGRVWKGHGTLGLKKGLEKSSNVYFARLGSLLGGETLRNYAEKFGFNRVIEWNTSSRRYKEMYAIRPSVFPEEMSLSDVAWASIGQQEVLVSPMHVALYTAAVANDGVMVFPRIELNRQNDTGWRIIKKSTALKLKKMLRNVVNSGTGYRANVIGLDVAGKTGTAEKTGMGNVSWFTAFAPYQDARIAVTVVIENGGYGGRDAAVIARDILIKAGERGYFTTDCALNK